LNESDAKVVVTMDLFIPSLYKVIKKHEGKNGYPLLCHGVGKEDPPRGGGPQPQLYQEVLATAQNTEEPAVHVSHGDIAVLQYTSGSTGAPKAATLTHYNLVASVLQSDKWIGIESAGNAAVMCVIPSSTFLGCRLVSSSLYSKDTGWSSSPGLI